MKGKELAGSTRKGSGAMAIMREISGSERFRTVTGCLFRALIGFAVSQAVVFEEYSPFGLGFAAIGGPGLLSISGLIGVCLGYLRLWQMTDSLKYISGAILIFTAMNVFRGTGVARNRFFPSVVTICSAFCVGFVFLVGRGTGYMEIVLFLTEMVLAGAAAYFYNVTFSEGSVGQADSDTITSVSLLVLMGTVLLALSGIELFAGISPGRLCAIVLILISATSGGIGAGSAAGVTMGMIFDIGGGGGFFSMSYGISGLLSGAVSAAGRLPCAIAFVLANAASVLVDGVGGIKTFALYEVFVATIMFMLIPQRKLPDLDIIGAGFLSVAGGNTGTGYFRSRLAGASRAFRDLHDTIKQSMERSRVKDSGDISQVFDKAAGRACRRCALKGLCWGRDCLNTYNIMNDITPRLIEKGRIDSYDLPDYFSSRCLKLELFVSSINEEMRAYQQMRHYRSKIERSHDMVCGQYGELSAILGRLAAQSTDFFAEDRQTTQKLRKWLKNEGAEADCVVWSGQKDRLHIEIEGGNLERLYAKRLSDEMKTLTGRAFGEPEYQRGPDRDVIRLRQKEPISAVIAIATHKKKGSAANGDHGTYFKTDDGELCVLLSDGMGSGKDAAAESGLVVRLMEKFLRAGVSPLSALEILNSAVAMKNEDSAEFATLDMLKVNLFSGSGTMLKCGAAPTFIKRGGEIVKIMNRTLPVGEIPLTTPGECINIDVKPGDCEIVLMVSDGVSDGGGDGWVDECMLVSDGQNPKELALTIAEEAVRRNGENDDITVVAVKLVHE